MIELKQYFTDEDGRLKTASFLLSVMLFFLPTYQQVSVISLVLFIVISLLRKDLLSSLKKAMQDKINLISMLFYLLHVFGIIYSENYPYAFADIQTKLSFIIFPLLIPSLRFTRVQYRLIFLSFVAGCITGGIISLAHAFISYSHTHDMHDFVYMKYSFLLHPTYFSLYLNLAFILLLDDLIQNHKFRKRLDYYNALAGLVFIGLNIIMISARTATAAAYATICLYAVYVIVVQKTYKSGVIILLLALGGCFIVQIKAMQIGSDRVEQVTHIMDKGKGEMNSVSIRVNLWQNAWDVIKEHPVFGVGTGDIKEALVSKYSQSGFARGVESKYSPHNQFLHTAVILGAMGVITLLCLFFFPMAKAFKTKDVVYFLFLLMVFLNCATEDVLEVQKGIIFFAIFNCLFYWRNFNHDVPTIKDKPGTA